MIIHLNENAFRKFFLVEGNHSKSSKRTRELIANEEGLSADDPRVIKYEQNFNRKYFSHGLDTDWFITLEPFAYKWFLNSGAFEYNVEDVIRLINKHARRVQDVKDRTAFMQKVKSLDTFEEVMNFIEVEEKKERDAIRNGTLEVNINQDYEEPILLTFEESYSYGQYSGLKPGKGEDKSSKICYTESEGIWMNKKYSNNNINKCFVLLRKDWKTVEPIHDGSEENNGLREPFNRLNGYDDYGLSMIFVWITPRGTLHASNTRWNHKAKYITDDVDQALTVGAIQDLMGAPFGSIFKVKTFYDKADPVYDSVINGKPIDEAFDSVSVINDSIAIVGLDGLYNIFSLQTNRLLYPSVWFDEISKFKGEFATVKLNGKLNLINKNGKLLCKQWLDNVIIYHDDIAFAKLGNKWSYITADGRMLGNQWFDKIFAFKNGTGQVMDKGVTGKVDLNGNLRWNK